MKTLLVTGGSGFLGSYLVKFFSDKYDVISTHFNKDASNSIKMDLSDTKSINALKNINPDIIVHAAGNKNVKWCEQNPELAGKINTVATENITNFAKGSNSLLIYISTDYVFSGNEGMYKEDSPTSPWTVYGKTKLGGERAVLAYDNSVICRTSGLYDYTPGNVFSFIYNTLKSGKSESYFSDVHNSATYLGNFAKMLAKVIEFGHKGTLHLAGSERINRYQFALKIAEVFGFDTSLINPVELGEAARKAQFRPYDLSLDVATTQKILKMRFFSVNEGLKTIKNEANIP